MATFIYIVMILILSVVAIFMAVHFKENGYGFVAGVLFGGMFAVVINMVNMLYYASK